MLFQVWQRLHLIHIVRRSVCSESGSPADIAGEPRWYIHNQVPRLTWGTWLFLSTFVKPVNFPAYWTGLMMMMMKLGQFMNGLSTNNSLVSSCDAVLLIRQLMAAWLQKVGGWQCSRDLNGRRAENFVIKASWGADELYSLVRGHRKDMVGNWRYN